MQCNDESDRLFDSKVVVRRRDGNGRRIRSKKHLHIRHDLRCHECAFSAIYQRFMARHITKVRAKRFLEMSGTPRRDIELPRPALSLSYDRMLRDMVEKVVVFTGLLGRQTKSRQDIQLVGIVTFGPIICCTRLITILRTWPNRGVDDNRAAQLRSVPRGMAQGHVCSETVSDDYGAIAKTRSFDHRGYFGHMNVTAVFRPASAIAHAREVERCDRTVMIEEGRDKGPPPRMRPAAMKEQNSRQGSFRRTPAQEMNGTSFDVNAVRAWHIGHRIRKPRRDWMTGQTPQPFRMTRKHETNAIG